MQLLNFNALLSLALICGVTLALVPDNDTFRNTATFTTPKNNSLLEAPNAASVCFDRKIGAIIDSALSYYAHNMDQLTKYVLDQILRARYTGQYLVHAQMINNYHQGPNWQSTTNGDLFTGRSRTGCYYHDTQTYVLVVRY